MHRFLIRILLVLLFIGAGLAASIITPAAAQCTPRTDWGTYVVAGGDTVFGIARRVGISPIALIQGNCLTNPNRLYPGQQLRVPAGSTPANPWPGGAPEYPYAAAQIGSTYQQFENGWMTWRADTGSIWVFVDQGGGGTVSAFPISVYGGLPTRRTIYSPIPPARTLPVFGFRKVYDNFPQVREALGWAIGGEQGFLMPVQPVAGQTYFTAGMPNGRILRLNRDGTWRPDDGIHPPSQVYVTQATFQPFQSGFMVWLANTGEIRVYIGSTTGEVIAYPVSRYGPLPERPIAPPLGSNFTVNFGFNKVWTNIDGIRQRLGWSTGGERGFSMTINETPGLWSFTLPGEYMVTRTNGNIWTVSGGLGNLPFGQVPPTPTPVPTLPVGAGPQLTVFDVTPPQAMPGDTITVEWNTINAGNVGLRVKYQADYRLFLDYTSEGLPSSGELTLTLPTHTEVYNTEAYFELYWANAAPENWTPIEGAMRTLQIGCPVQLFWNPNRCGHEPVQDLAAVYQPFERGFMLQAGEAKYSVIFNDEHSATIYGGRDPVELGTPPDGLFAPDAVFVDLWTSTPQYQEWLGWATGPAQTYTAQMQTAHYRIRDTMQFHYVTMPDGRVLELRGSGFGGPAVGWDWVE